MILLFLLLCRPASNIDISGKKKLKTVEIGGMENSKFCFNEGMKVDELLGWQKKKSYVFQRNVMTFRVLKFVTRSV